MRVPVRPLRRFFSSASESCSSSNLAVNLARPLTSLRTVAATSAQPQGCCTSSSRNCNSCAPFPHRGVHVASQGSCNLGNNVLHSVCSASVQKCLCHVCTYDGNSRLLHHVSKRCCASSQRCCCHGGIYDGARNGSYASSQRGFCHGSAESKQPAGLHSQEVTGNEEERKENKQGLSGEDNLQIASVIDLTDTAALSDSKDGGLFEEKASKDSNLLKKTGAIRSIAERRRGIFSRHSQGKIPDLLSVPGIGPRNMEKLVAKGIGGVAELKQLYLDKFRRDGKDKMIEYLQSSVGIIHRHHAMSITTYIKDTVEKELHSEESLSVDATAKRRLTFCVEGNISVGKTTFLHRVTNEAIELRDLVEIVPEPVAKWQDVGPEHFNILDAFYAEPQRYAYTFQNYVFITRLMQEQESAGGLKPLRLMERSVFSDRMVFVRAVHEAKWMNEMEISIYDSWFNPVVSVLPGLVPDGFIYLRASPDTCHKRLQMRKRPEEQSVTLEYLKGLHEKHEQWLFPSSSNNEGVFSVSRPSQLIEPLPPMLQDRVYYLQGEHVHSSLQKVPALILDCEANIDFTRDLEAKAAYAKQVSEFFEYVKRMKELEPKAESVPPQDMLSRVAGFGVGEASSASMPFSSL
ncbi:hypothetical protein GOP47_0008058 [Adiantum capillus-veneris]|uniref:Deoxynucleoside kinase domain-containing protein n=1 Tax=Adiantum capillus-veneris TaxID=13818 RepID=A0A9D4UYL8_ADICA|nr:hypothetical protein GOP47_0008058 [Adiantum capillus-veneris]